MRIAGIIMVVFGIFGCVIGVMMYFGAISNSIISCIKTDNQFDEIPFQISIGTFVVSFLIGFIGGILAKVGNRNK